MNETASDKKKQTVVEKYFAELHGDGKLTRIPVEHLYFAETIDFQGCGESQMSNKACVRPSAENRRHFVCDFIPAWQVFELTFVPGGDSQPITELLPAPHIRRWKKA